MVRGSLAAALTAASLPAPAFGIPLLYVDTGPVVEVIDVDAGVNRKVIPLLPPSVGFAGPFNELVVSGDRVYALAQPGPEPVITVIDPQRSAVVDAIELVAHSADPTVPARHFVFPRLLRAGDDGSIVMLADELPSPFPISQPLLSFFVTVDPRNRTVTAVPSPVQSAPPDPACVSAPCSDEPPCICETIMDVAGPRGGRTWAVRSRFRSLPEPPFTRVDATLINVDLATGDIIAQVAVGALDSPTVQLLLTPDGGTAFVHGLGSVTVVDLRVLQVVRSLTFAEQLFPVTLAPDGLSLYAFAPGIRPGAQPGGSVVVLDARPPFVLEQLRRLPFLDGRRGTFPSSIVVSPDGTRLAGVFTQFARSDVSSRAVTIGTLGGETISDVELRFPPISGFAGFAGLVGPTFVDACSDPTGCYCNADSDCAPGSLCDVGSCAGADGCLYDEKPCFDGARCTLNAAATTTTTTTTTLLTTNTTTTITFPLFPVPKCDEVLERLARLGGEVLDRLDAGISLPPGTEVSRYRRAVRRAQAAVRKRIKAELVLAVAPRPIPPPDVPPDFPPPLRRSLRRSFGTTRACVGRDLGVYLKILQRLKRLGRHANACAAAGG